MYNSLKKNIGFNALVWGCQVNKTRNMNKNTNKTKHEQHNWRTNMLIYYFKIWLLASTFGFQTVGL